MTDSLKNYVAIEPYQSGYDMTFTELELRTMYIKGLGVDIDVQPCTHNEWGGVECMMMCYNPIEDGMTIKRIPMARKNQKQLEAIHADLVGMKDKIADLWNKRDFDGIKALFA